MKIPLQSVAQGELQSYSKVRLIAKLEFHQNSTHFPQTMPSVAINPSNLWRLGNTNFLHKIAEIGRKRRYDYVVNDLVVVCGGKDAGKVGKVRSIIPELDQVIVEGVHTRIHTIPKADGGEMHLLIDRAIPSEYVQLVHPKTLQPVRTEWTRVDTEFGYQRFTRFLLPNKTEELPFPRVRGLNPAGPRDTTVEDAFRVTYRPDLNQNPLPYGCFI